MNISTTRALKEWAIAISALNTGNTILLLRKGGIRETENQFQVQENDALIWLYPTYEHQRPEHLKPGYRAQVTPVESGWHPETLEITSGAKITHRFNITQESQVKGLSEEYIWTEDYICDRLHWKPKNPLCLLLLRVYRLPEAVSFPYRDSYGGCKSWIDLQSPIIGDTLVPAMGDREYEERCDRILNLLKD